MYIHLKNLKLVCETFTNVNIQFISDIIFIVICITS